MFDWVIDGLGSLFGFVSDPAGAVAEWAWEKVTTGIYTWLANGLALLIEWVWSVFDSGTTPRVTAGPTIKPGPAGIGSGDTTLDR